MSNTYLVDYPYANRLGSLAQWKSCILVTILVTNVLGVTSETFDRGVAVCRPSGEGNVVRRRGVCGGGESGSSERKQRQEGIADHGR